VFERFTRKYVLTGWKSYFLFFCHQILHFLGFTNIPTRNGKQQK
jgi:hypothetical protein